MLKTIKNLKDEYDRLVESHVCIVKESDYEKIKDKLESFKSLATVENKAISLYDLHKKKFLLKVDKHIELLGYTSKDSIDIDSICRYHEKVHSDDLPYLYDSEIKMYHFLNSIGGIEKKDFKLVYDYRVRNNRGLYVRFLHQLAILELDQYFSSWLLLILSDVISLYPKDESPRRFLLNIKTNRVHLFNEESGIKNYIITKREKEILGLIAQGFDSKEIADKLCISTSTVNNHRQHILRKTSTNSITQATIYLKCIGIL